MNKALFLAYIIVMPDIKRLVSSYLLANLLKITGYVVYTSMTADQ